MRNRIKKPTAVIGRFLCFAYTIILDLGSCGITQCAHSSQLTAPLCTQARTNTNTHFYPLEIAVQFSDSQSRLNVGAIYWSPKF